jgi:hypothetical protein
MNCAIVHTYSNVFMKKFTFRISFVEQIRNERVDKNGSLLYTIITY